MYIHMYVRPGCAFELSVCKYFLTDCLFACVCLCVCLCVCAMLIMSAHLSSVSASIFLLVACLRVCLCEFVCMCYVKLVGAFGLGVCKYFLTGCLFEYVFVCVCVYVCARVRRHSSTLAGTRRYSYTHTCVGRASRSHVRKV